MLESAERQFVERLKAGEEAAFVDLVRQYGPRLLQTATRILADPVEANDCLQETFLQVHKNISGFREEARLATWLHRILVNSCLMKLRRRKTDLVDSFDDLSPSFDADGCRIDEGWHLPNDVEEQVHQREIREIVLRAIERLPDNYRAVLVLRDIEGYSTEETAEALSLSAANVKVRLHRSRAALKILLDQEFAGAKP